HPPGIISFIRAGKTGDAITINGINLTGTTAVKFGGVPATSVTVYSSQQISAVVGQGKSGDLTVVTPGGSTTATGFVFVPIPTITTSGPTTFDVGGNVTLTASPLVGGFTYQWIRNGTYVNGGVNSTYVVTQGGSYSVLISYFNVDVESVQKVQVNVKIKLPADNFTISATSATCKGANNGIIDINAVQAMDYIATVTGGSLNKSVSFTTTAQIGDLTPGTYHACITIANQPDYQQCYYLVITEPKDLSLFSTVNYTDNSLKLSLSGAERYFIDLNGKRYTTSDNSITLKLQDGNNTLKVNTDRLCQGIIQKIINLSSVITPYPVPFQQTLNLNIGNENAKDVTVEIHNVTNGKTVFTKQYTNQSGVIQFDLSDLKTGVYALHLYMNNVEKIFKVIKK
ncbi:MAG: T9SS type A sorting domain-containing protein, partial [Mucilaginibacter sp.]